VLLVPLTAVTLQVTQEAQIVMQWLTEAKKSGLASPDWLAKTPFIGPFASAWWQANLADPNIAAQWLERLDTAAMLAWSKAFGVQLLSRLITLGLTLLTLYFLYRDGEYLAQQTLSVARRALGESGERYAIHTASTLRATVNGLVLVGLGEGVLLGGAYAVSGLAHPALLGALSGLLAIIPFAVPFIFIGASLVLLGQGSEGAALALFVFGVVVVFMADHFIRPAVIGGATRLPFLWVLLGILGGLETFGLLGLFLGPAVMAALISVWRDWTEVSS
jgi:predicted PurR-regulated permease PerM